ncbi:hypothetical protein ACKFKG_26310 [Phormidesmis sp. 146-35]
MAKVVQAITAKVEAIRFAKLRRIGKLKTGNHGKYRSVLFLDQAQPQGSEAAKIWKSLSEEEAKDLIQGAIVQLVPAGKDRSGKDKHNIVRIDANLSHTAKRAIHRPDRVPATWSDEQKLALSAQICDHADLLRFCLEVAHEKFAGLADQRDFRALATTLYLQVLRQQADSELNS